MKIGDGAQTRNMTLYAPVDSHLGRSIHQMPISFCSKEVSLLRDVLLSLRMLVELR